MSSEVELQPSPWVHCGNLEPHVTHTYKVSDQGVPTHCLGTPWPAPNARLNELCGTGYVCVGVFGLTVIITKSPLLALIAGTATALLFNWE